MEERIERERHVGFDANEREKVYFKHGAKQFEVYFYCGMLVVRKFRSDDDRLLVKPVCSNVIEIL